MNDEWFKLETNQTESYYYLTGLVYTKRCESKDQDRDKGVSDGPYYIDDQVPILYSIDRSTMILYETVFVDVKTPNACKTQDRRRKGETLNTFMNYCRLSKIKF